MNKLSQLFDNYILKIGVIIAIAFTALYPKLPSISITNTWVYIRLEDFLIAVLGIIWLIQLIRKKVKLPFPEAWGIVIYWIVGFISLMYCFAFVSPHLINFFPKIAFLQYIRRVEYMILFFIAFTSVRSKKDIRDYVITLIITIAGICIYGFGQRFYLVLWTAFPNFFKQFPFCFPAFLTGNEEFAKGIPLCLTETSRIASTFGGHYDLAAYLVFTIPIIIGVFLVVKKWYVKFLLAVVGVFSIMLLNFTSSRVSFGAYIVGIVTMLVIWKKKLWIIPMLAISFLVIFSSKGDTLQRIIKTIQPVNIVTVKSGTQQLPSNLQKILSKTKEDIENKSPETPPPGTVTIGKDINKSSIASNGGSLTTVINDTTLKELNEENITLSTVSGSFLIQKAYALDISFTTRFQAEWPRDWKAFLSRPLFGTGYSSLTLASDNDYLRALGETGVLGLFSFLLIFIILGIYLRKMHTSTEGELVNGLVFGLAGGVVGLLMNAIMIDVFEASKVAEPLWLLLGIGAGGLALYHKKNIDYKKELIGFFTSRVLIAMYFLLAGITLFISSINTFFVGDDFTWLHWAASATTHDIPKYFMDAQGFFYRPLDKTIMFALYNVFSFVPQGYHIFAILLHVIMSIGVLFVVDKLFKKRLYSFIAGFIFLILPMHAENLFWISTMSDSLASIFMIYGLLAFLHFRQDKSIVGYITAIVMGILALLSYEMAIIYPLILIAVDICFENRFFWKKYLVHIPFILLSLGYLPLRTLTHTVAAGGDYSYNLYHFIPNFFGNILGYLSLYIFGEPSLSQYAIIREMLRVHALPILIVLVVLILIALFYSKKMFTFFKNSHTKIMLFGLLVMLIGLLPFVGLGNIAERYGYFASFGYVVLLCGLVQYLLSYMQGIKSHVYIMGAILLVVFTWWSVLQLQKEQHEWSYAGDITYHTLTAFRIHYPTFPEYTVLYFYNVPIRQDEAWIFPVGLNDALWFIYRDDTMQVHQAKSAEEAISMQATLSHDITSYIYFFDKNKKVHVLK